MPLRAQGDDLFVELDAHAVAHAHDHRIAAHGVVETALPAGNEVGGYELVSLLRADDRLALRPGPRSNTLASAPR